jgi:hypothetical protein
VGCPAWAGAAAPGAAQQQQQVGPSRGWLPAGGAGGVPWRGTPHDARRLHHATLSSLCATPGGHAASAGAAASPRTPSGTAASPSSSRGAPSHPERACRSGSPTPAPATTPSWTVGGVPGQTVPGPCSCRLPAQRLVCGECCPRPLRGRRHSHTQPVAACAACHAVVCTCSVWRAAVVG